MVRDAVSPRDDLERMSLFFPIKVVNGFVSCDFMLGCYCCRFCLNRRYPDWHAMLETRKVYRNALSVERAAALLSQVKAFTRARVTLKVGHDTDMSLEEPQAQALTDLLPADHPIVFMRRGALPSKHRAWYQRARPNLLMKLTLTPRSPFLDATADPFAILDSFRGIAQPMFFAIGPVIDENLEEARAVVRALPPGSRLWVRDLITKDIPRFDKTVRVAEPPGESLRRYAVEQGHHIVHYLNCLVRAELGLPFHKRGEFVSEPNPWQVRWSQHCKVLGRCGAEVPEDEARERIDDALGDLDLTLDRPVERFGHKSYRVTVREDVNFGDECYLRELTSLKCDLERLGRKTGTALSASIADRWRNTHFFPVDEVLELARESYARVQQAIDGRPVGAVEAPEH